MNKQNQSVIDAQLARLGENRSKNHDQIVDAIYEREANRHEKLFKDNQDYKVEHS